MGERDWKRDGTEKERERQRERETDRQTDRRKTDRPTHARLLSKCSIYLVCVGLSILRLSDCLTVCLIVHFSVYRS